MNPGLELFAPGTPPAVRRRRLIFLAVWIAVTAMLVWPIYPLFAAAEPRLLGLPLSFAWVIVALFVQFGALVWLFFHEPDSDGEED